MKKAIITLLVFGLMQICRAETVTLTLGWKNLESLEIKREITTKSAVITLNPGQVAKVIHFHCFEEFKDQSFTNPSGQTISDLGWLESTINGFSIKYAFAIDSMFGGGLDFTQNDFSPAGMPVIVGPATIQLNVNLSGDGAVPPGSPIKSGGCICTLDVSGQTSITQPLQPTEVVVEPDNDGPVEVLIESSIDMKQTWQPTAPGIFGDSDDKRFFRLRTIKR